MITPEQYPSAFSTASEDLAIRMLSQLSGQLFDHNQSDSAVTSEHSTSWLAQIVSNPQFDETYDEHAARFGMHSVSANEARAKAFRLAGDYESAADTGGMAAIGNIGNTVVNFRRGLISETEMAFTVANSLDYATRLVADWHYTKE